MAINRWPTLEEQLRWPEEMFRAFAPFFTATSGVRPSRSAGVFPPVNIYDDGESFLVRTEIPGVEKDTLEISVKGDELTLRGERKQQAADPKAAYHRRESEGGQFRRVVTLPQPVDAEKITATFKHGVLEVVLPRVPEAQPRKIAVN
jgi:HSP20 family protein